MTSAITATGLRKSFGGETVEVRGHTSYGDTSCGAIECAGGEDTGSEGASR